MVLGAPFVAAGLLRPAAPARLEPGDRAPGSTTAGCTRARAPPRGWRSAAAEDVEHVARAMAPTPYVALHPPTGLGCRSRVDAPPDDRDRAPPLGPAGAGGGAGLPDHAVGRLPLGPGEPARRRAAGAAAHHAGSTPASETPRPVGLVGVNRSPRLGAGVEFADIRPFRPGDRLRRISWRVSVRSRELHVTTSPAEEDSGVLLVIDALGDHGHSGGLDGEASSLDQSVRAAAAVAEHHIRAGDRVGLRIVGGRRRAARVRRRHAAPAARCFDLLAGVRAGELPEGIANRLQLRVTGGSVVFVFSPMLGAAIVTATASLVQRGLPVVVVDTLPPGASPRVPDGVDPRIADLAWRMRRLERDQVLAGLAALGCPVIAWRGAGTLDDVLRRLARRGQRPAACCPVRRRSR